METEKTSRKKQKSNGKKKAPFQNVTELEKKRKVGVVKTLIEKKSWKKMKSRLSAEFKRERQAAKKETKSSRKNS